jgi:hypothetical protein
MTNMTAARIEQFALILRELSQEIEPKLHLVSPSAREEWKAFQRTWPSDGQLRHGAKGLTEGQLEALMAKARRFTDIVRGMALTHASEPRQRSLDEGAAISRPPFEADS